MALSYMQQPRQQYGLGSLVKSIGKGVKKFVKSPLGKAAILGFGGAGLMGMGPFSGLSGIGSRMGGALFGTPAIGGTHPILDPGKYATKGLLGGLMGKIPGGGYTLGAIGSILAASGMDPEEIEATKRDPEKLKIYLRDYYSKTNPDKSAQEVEEFVETNVSEYATGGRVGYSEGGDYEDKFMELVSKLRELGFSQQEAIEEAKKKLDNNMAQGGRVGLKWGTLPPERRNPDREATEQELMMINKRHGDLSAYIDNMIQGENTDKLREKLNQETKEALLRAKGGRSYAQGGRIGLYAGTPEDTAQAAGIMGQLPVRQNKAGVNELDLRETGGFIPPVGVKEKADDVPAMLSNNEFVWTADAVRAAGGGSVNKGAQILYDQMKKLEGRVV